jgi:hypothetical protein
LEERSLTESAFNIIADIATTELGVHDIGTRKSIKIQICENMVVSFDGEAPSIEVESGKTWEDVKENYRKRMSLKLLNERMMIAVDILKIMSYDLGLQAGAL